MRCPSMMLMCSMLRAEDGFTIVGVMVKKLEQGKGLLVCIGSLVCYAHHLW